MVDKDTVRRGYDELGDTYTDERAPDGDEETIIRRFLASLSTPARLLDAGCGQHSPVLDRLPADAAGLGLDISRAQLTGAAESRPGMTLLQGDLAHVPLAADSVDAVTALHSLIHVPAGQHQQVIDEFGRVLAPGGRLLVSEGPGEWTGRNPDWLGTDVEMEWTIAGADATREQLRSAGFAIEAEWTAGDDLAEEDAKWVFFEAVLAE